MLNSGRVILVELDSFHPTQHSSQNKRCSKYLPFNHQSTVDTPAALGIAEPIPEGPTARPVSVARIVFFHQHVRSVPEMEEASPIVSNMDIYHHHMALRCLVHHQKNYSSTFES